MPQLFISNFYYPLLKNLSDVCFKWSKFISCSCKAKFLFLWRLLLFYLNSTTEAICYLATAVSVMESPLTVPALGRFYGVVDEDAGAGEAGREADLLYPLHHYQYPPQRRVSTVQEERLVPPYFPESSIFYGKILKKN